MALYIELHRFLLLLRSKSVYNSTIRIVLGGHYYMAQDTIKCYDSPSDVVQALAEDFITFTKPYRYMRCGYYRGHCCKWFVRIT